MFRSSKVKRYSLKKSWWKRNYKKIIPIIVLAGYLYYLLFGPYGFINIIRLKTYEINLRNEKLFLKERREALIDSLEMIENDTLLLERIAREKLGMIKSGDTIIIIKE